MDIRPMNTRRTTAVTLALLLPLALVACAGGDRAPSSEPAAPMPPPASNDSAGPGPGTRMLGGQKWRLVAATDAQGRRIDALFPADDRPLTLEFEDRRVGVSGGCNRIGGSYEVDAQGRLQVGRLVSTMMACDEALMQADKAIGALLSQPLLPRIEETAPPRLKLEAADGGSSTWVGEATAETRFGGPGETVFLEVAPQRVACNHPLIPDYQCLQVREIRYGDNGVKQSPPGEWQPLYEGIEGFEFVAGERKVLRLKKFERDPAPADASSVVYVLDMVVESEIVPAQ
ncbi:MAG: META domain-containing protein [Lysobacter sp.]